MPSSLNVTREPGAATAAGSQARRAKSAAKESSRSSGRGLLDFCAKSIFNSRSPKFWNRRLAEIAGKRGIFFILMFQYWRTFEISGCGANPKVRGAGKGRKLRAAAVEQKVDLRRAKAQRATGREAQHNKCC